MKPVSKKQQATVDHVTGDKIPRSFVFSRYRLPGPLKQLQADLRKLMLPYTALKLKVRKYLFWPLLLHGFFMFLEIEKCYDSKF